MSLTLFDCATAPSPRRARIFLREKGVAFETVEVDLASGAQMDDAYRAINPHCTVPALRLPCGAVLTDNAAIAAYLEGQYPEPPLMGTTPLEKACIASWQWRMEFEGLWAVAEAFRNAHPAMVNRALPGPHAYAQIPELAERGRQRWQAFMTMLDGRLAEAKFVAGAQFSVADITAVVAVDFARVIRAGVDERHPHVQRWRAELAERPSMAA